MQNSLSEVDILIHKNYNLHKFGSARVQFPSRKGEIFRSLETNILKAVRRRASQRHSLTEPGTSFNLGIEGGREVH